MSRQSQRTNGAIVSFQLFEAALHLSSCWTLNDSGPQKNNIQPIFSAQLTKFYIPCLILTANEQTKLIRLSIGS